MEFPTPCERNSIRARLAQSAIGCPAHRRTYTLLVPPSKSTLKTFMATPVDSGDDVCQFCQIANSHGDTEILLSDSELLCFRDVKPGAAHHYLVITRTHIDNCKALRKENIPTVERMAEMGRSILEKNKVRDLQDIRMGFHVPPFSSVPHLHLHALAPASKMNMSSQLKYGPQSHWFITVEKALCQLRTRGKIK
ncbi:adenosine 5'-monophosphoramidase HINT3-like isoform X1 [Dunckerocampus dactyliophorus]|uniref:adenosine 5'-monophosphoramidase HINT3-like isoform X1 n=1 Tax=Dunckerocampus dactyliophorus TaxID=161453 RepID=UPI00240663DF|nr:adenosine 5'-monophosphoramidase HINT3-like isoform X1 [Dunckerocampus dactyliophorus]